VFLNGNGIPGHDERGRTVVDQSFFVLFNGHMRTVYWALDPGFGDSWMQVFDTDRLEAGGDGQPVSGRAMARARSVVVLESAPGIQARPQ
jgi:glycogen operon protein